MRLASVIFPITLIAIPAFGQPAKIYKWQHPWFKKEITSPTPPTWPYRVVEEKNGIVRVEVTPPVPPTATQEAPDKAASRATVEEPSVLEWPFTVPTGVLNCEWLGDLRLVTLTANGVTYAINPPARARIKKFGWQDGDDIWKRDPKNPESRVSSDIVDRGRSLCRRQPAVSTQPAPAPVSAEQTLQKKVLNGDSAYEINDKIRKKCEREWDGNYRMQVYCMKNHRAAIPFLEEFAEEAKLETHKRKIYQHCSGNWLSEDNYRMMKYCVEKQMEAYQTLNQ